MSYIYAALFLVHYLGIFPVSYISDHYGEFLMAAVIIGDVTSVFWYIFGLFYELDPKTGYYIRNVNKEHQPTGCVYRKKLAKFYF